MVGNMGGFELVIALLWLGLVISVLTAFFRGMRALTEIPRRLERIEALLAERRDRDDSGGY